MKDIKITKKLQRKISLTDQKKQPCLAAKAVNLNIINQFCITESLQNNYTTE